MLRGSVAVSAGAMSSPAMGEQRCRRIRADLTYRVIPMEQGKPVSLLARGRDAARQIDSDAGMR